MAEFPELGKNCSLRSCNRLDYTPYFCESCKLYYCGAHRLSHGCAIATKMSTIAGSNRSNTAEGPSSIRPFLCSLDGCHAKESVRIECEFCQGIFCLSHRHADQHKCVYAANANDEKEKRKELWNEIQKKIQSSDSYVRSATDKANTTTASEVQIKKAPLSEAEQKRNDRIAVMKLKSKMKTCEIPRSEQMFLIISKDQSRIPVMISKRWTIGKCVDKIARELKIPTNKKSDSESKLLRLYSADSSDSNTLALPMADIVTEHLSDMQTVLLKRDE